MTNDIKNIKILHVNATRIGGGVAEMLQSLIPELQSEGYDVEWFVPEFPDDFFVITKKFHNALQGMDQNISLKNIKRYLEVCESIVLPDADLYIIHDPQCLAIPIPEGSKKVFRLHIDSSESDRVLASILTPYINQYDGAIFTDESYVLDGITVPIFEVNPCIDLNTIKNQPHVGDYAQKHLDLPKDTPIVGAVSRFDPHKGQENLIKAFKLLNHPTAHLVILGNMAADDPEGEAIFNYFKTIYASDKIHIIAMNDVRAVGSLCAMSDIFIHPATKEGFGLVVSEALNQETPVIGGNVGGIPKQIIDGETGFLVNPNDINIIANKIQYALDNPKEMKEMGKKGKQYVQDHFTLKQLVESHLNVYEAILDV